MITTTRRAIDAVDAGHTVSVSRKITEADIQKFAEVSGDFNPLHLDEEYARRTIFGSRIAHGIMAVGLISAALAQLPGVVVYLSQSVQFIRPVRIGDTIEAVVEVIEKAAEESEVRLRTFCRNQRGEPVLEGEARVKLLDLKETSE